MFCPDSVGTYLSGRCLGHFVCVISLSYSYSEEWFSLVKRVTASKALDLHQLTIYIFLVHDVIVR